MAGEDNCRKTKLSDRVLRDYVAGDLSSDMRRVISDIANWDMELRTRIDTIRAAMAHGGQPAVGVPGVADRGRCIPRPSEGLRAGVPRSALMLAAGVVLGLLSYHLSVGAPKSSSHPLLGLRSGLIDPAGALHAALETRMDGRQLTAAGERGAINPLSTFRIANSRYCREFDVTLRAGPAYAGLACNARGRGWSLELLVPVSRSDTNSTSYAPASSRSAELMAQTIESLKAEPSLSETAVQSLIQSGWRSP